MAINHDYFCAKCGAEKCDIITGAPQCCGQAMGIHYGRITGPAKFNPNAASMYGKYHPGFGCIVEDYSHKQRLLKKFDVIEAADPVKGSRQHERPPGYQGPGKEIVPQKEESKQLGGWINGPEDIKRLEKEARDGIGRD